MENPTSLCSVCIQPILDINSSITCTYCSISTHFKCKNISAKAKHKMKQNTYYCDTKCAELSKCAIQKQAIKTTLTTLVSAEIKSIVSQIDNEMKTVRGEIQSVTTAIEKSQDYLASKFDMMVQELNKLKSENITLRKQIDTLKESELILKSTVGKLENAFNKTANDAISNNTMFLGLPFKPNENVTGLIRKTVQTIGVTLNDHSIISATRLYSPKNPNNVAPIKVVFNSKVEKESIFLRKKEIGKLMSTAVDNSLRINGQPSRIVIRDELTSSTIELLNEMRSVQQKYKIKYIWPGRCGHILMKLNENAIPITIKNRYDFECAISRLC